MTGLKVTLSSNEILKIDSLATDGLLGVEDSLAYRVHETEAHLHHYTRAFGLAAVPAGETHRADLITSNPAPFVIDAGNNDWGVWVQVFGSADTPADWVKFDPNQVNIVGAQVANVVYFIQMALGASGDAGLAAGTYSDRVFTPQSANGRPAAIPFNMRRQAAGTLIWMRTLARGTDTAELDIYLTLHGYPG